MSHKFSFYRPTGQMKNSVRMEIVPLVCLCNKIVLLGIRISVGLKIKWGGFFYKVPRDGFCFEQLVCK